MLSGNLNPDGGQVLSRLRQGRKTLTLPKCPKSVNPFQEWGWCCRVMFAGLSVAWSVYFVHSSFRKLLAASVRCSLMLMDFEDMDLVGLHSSVARADRSKIRFGGGGASSLLDADLPRATWRLPSA